jgi:hypothetical protein
MNMLLFVAAFNKRMAEKKVDFMVSEWHFCEPQWGKGVLDTHFRYELCTSCQLFCFIHHALHSVS